MRYLLDSRVVVWMFEGSAKLSGRAKRELESSENEKFVSAASAWELAIKNSLGKLRFEGGIKNFFKKIHVYGYNLLPVKQEHIERVAELPFHRRDPFDRLLVAAALAESMRIVTADANIRLYGVDPLW